MSEQAWLISSLDPRHLIAGKDDEAGRFFLALALAYNDLKGLATFREMVELRAAAASGDAGLTGEFNGLRLQLHRQVAALLHELCRLLMASRRIVESELVERLASAMPLHAAQAWGALVDVALERDGRPDKLRPLLERIRDNLAAHYYQPKDLARGFESHFFGPGKSTHSGRAHYAAGDSPADTRFFYADAAAFGGITRWSKEMKVTSIGKELATMSMVVSLVLRYLIAGFIEDRSRGADDQP